MGFGPERFLPTASNINCFVKTNCDARSQHCFFCFVSSCKQLLPHTLFIINPHWTVQKEHFFFPRGNNLKKRSKQKGRLEDDEGGR